MWQPEAGWHPLPGGTGPSTVGVWRTADGGQPLVVKRLSAPDERDPAEWRDPTHPTYWRREADVHICGLLTATPGLQATAAAVEEDSWGVTITAEWVEDAALSGLFVCSGLGRFAGADLPRPRWLSRGQLRERLRQVEHRGGWPTLARTTVADVAEHLWTRRHTFLDALDLLPQVPQHGDPTGPNLRGRRGDDVLAIDWSTVGLGAVGSDLGYFALSARESFEPLLDSYLMGLPPKIADREDVLMGARITSVYTALTRAEWALSRVAGGEGALAGKYRHPSVAPYIRALQRQFEHIEALLGWS
ncbi:hypothetical protein GCM10027020_08150 [Nocardioides salsibiostraticola]